MIAGSKPSVNEEAIRYQARTKLAALAGEIAEARRLDKPSVKAKIKQATQIRLWLKALDYKEYLSREQRERIYYALIDIADINDFPTAPLLELRTTPNILVGVPGTTGEDGEDGEDGEQGETGLATDFQGLALAFSIAVDDFLVTDAYAARWDYYVKEVGGAARAGSVVALWDTDGSPIDYFDTSTPDINSSTAGIEFDVQYSSGSIFLIATITSGTWDVRGSRYFIPNNGNGTGPISGILADGQIYVGNTANIAQARSMSGDVTISNTGVASIVSGVIVNADVNAAAGITVSKLAALTASRVVGTDGSGFLSALDTATYPSLAELAHVKGVTSAIQTQLDSKMTDPMSNAGDIIIRNGVNSTVRLAIGSPNQVLTSVGGVPTWATPSAGFSDPMTTLGDLIIRGSGGTTRLGIGTLGQFLRTYDTGSGLSARWETFSGFVNPMTSTGDIIYSSDGSGTPARRAIGTANQALITSGGLPVWSTLPAGATNELQKNGGSGLFGTTNVYATSSGLGINNAAPTYGIDLSASTEAFGTLRVRQTSTFSVASVLERTGGTASNWNIYLPAGSTDLRLYSAADRFTFTTAGLFTATSLQATSLTSGRVPFVSISTGGLLVDESGFTYSSPDLFVGHLNAGTPANGIELLNTGYLQPYGTNVNLNVVGFSGTVGSNNGGNLLLLAGTAYAASGSGNGGNVTIKAGAKGPAGGTNGTIQIGDKTKVTYLDSGLSTSGSIYSGYFAINATGVNVTDLDTFGDGQFMRVGNVVTGSGLIGVEPSVAFGSVITVYIDLPIATTLSANNKLAGTAVGISGGGTDPSPGMIDADIVGNRARLQFRAYDTADRSWSFHFTYLID